MTAGLDPQLQELLQVADEAGVPAIHTFSYVKAREFYRLTSAKLAGEPPQNLTVTEQTLELSTAEIPIRIYRPESSADEPQPALIYFHGGGWCIGDLDSHDHVCRWLASHSNCVILSVDYRMGPEYKFPAAVDDAFGVTYWVASNSRELGIDADRIGVGGDSAGGNLSAVVTLLAREQGAPNLACQLLIYPATDMLMRFPSHATCGDGYRLTRTSIAWFISGYLRDGEDMYDMRASPLMADSHADLPPAFVMTAAFDPLKDEGEAYAEKLKESGVKVKYSCYQGMVHGFIAMPGAVDMAKTALLDAAHYLKEQLHA
jgi:acetyl esterase